MKRHLHDYRTFFRAFRRQFKTTGAVSPSGRYLAKALCGPLKRKTGPARVLEVGPGTGAVTREIVQLLGPDDHFDLVELNDHFVELLTHHFQNDPKFLNVADISTIHHLPLQEFHASEPYDYIISGLPLNNFSVELVEEIFDSYWRLLAPGGTLSYFEYMHVRPIRRLVSNRDEKQRIDSLNRIFGEQIRAHRVKCDSVYVNVLPAWAHHLSRRDPSKIKSAATN